MRVRCLREASLLLLLSFSLLPALSGTGLGEEPTGPEPPKDVVISQVEYGTPETLEVAWSSAVLYDAIEVALDDEPVASLEGSSLEARVFAEPGARRVSVRGVVGAVASAWTTAAFEALDESPIPRPVTDLRCDFFPDMGGRIHVQWSPGPDPWASGSVEIPRWRIEEDFGPDATDVEVEAPPEDPHVAWVVFKNTENYCSPTFPIVCATRSPSFLRGDCDRSGGVNLTDAVYELNHLFRGGQRWFCDDACDSNDDGAVNLSDPVATLRHLFMGSGPLPLPGTTECGADLTPDLLGGWCTCP